MTRKIVFHHVPKCGGTSITRGLVRALYPLRLVSRGKGSFCGLNAQAASSVSDYLQLESYEVRRAILAYEVERDKSPFVYGHFPFSIAVFDRHHGPWDFVTLLRNPVQRWYSEYFYNRYKSFEYAKTELDIEAYLDTPAGLIKTRSFLNYFGERGDILATPSQADVDMAIQNLSRFTVVGLLENLGDFAQKIKHKFGRKPVFFRTNKSPAPGGKKTLPDEDSEFHRRLVEHLAGDIEIYRSVADNPK